MALCFLEVVATVQRVVPGVEEELGPVCVANEQAAACKAVVVLREHEVYALAFQVCESLDHTVRRHDGLIGDHEAFEFWGVEDFVRKWLAGVHYQRGGCEVEDPVGVWVESQSVAESGYCGPGLRDVGHEVVVGGAGEEGLIAVALGIVAAVVFDIVCVRGAECRVYGCDDDDS